jgi:hypothetical protein
MPDFADITTKQVYETRFAPTIPTSVSVSAHELMHPLAAAHSLQDVGVLGKIARWQSQPGRYGLHVHGKWYVTFEWSTFGARGIRIERR